MVEELLVCVFELLKGAGPESNRWQCKSDLDLAFQIV